MTYTNPFDRIPTQIDAAKHKLAQCATSIFEMSNRLAEVAYTTGALDKEQVWWFTDRFYWLLEALLSDNVFQFLAEEDDEDSTETVIRVLNERLHSTYGDGSPCWRVVRSDEPDPAPKEFYHGDLLVRLGDVLGPVEPSWKVTAESPPPRRPPEDTNTSAFGRPRLCIDGFRGAVRKRTERRRASSGDVEEHSEGES